MTGAMHKLKILIVDDDPDIAGAFTHIFQSTDYEVYLVSYYRNYTLSVRGGNTSDGQQGEAGRGETHE